MTKRFVVLAAALALIGAGPAHSQPRHDVPVASAAKSCSSGFTHAYLPWGEKCLRRGEFCKMTWNGRSANRYYRRYGYTCRGGRLR